MMRGVRYTLAVMLGLTGVHGAPAAPPPLLQGLFESHTIWRALDPPTDLQGDDAETLALLASRVPWIERDLDGDHRLDVAAVVVATRPTGRQFGVVAVHAGAPRVHHWVVPFAAEPIRGVSAWPAADTVQPDFCIECDSNPWFRWSGTRYEPRLYAVGDTVTFVERLPGQPPVTLFTSPNERTPGTTAVPSCGTARVLRRGGSPEARWYHVQLPGTPASTGWIPATLLIEPIDCA